MSMKGKDISFGHKIFDEIKKRQESYNYNEEKEEFRCKKCDSIILQTTAYVSLHLRSMLGGFGKVETYPFPYCPKCEGEPEIIRGTRYY